MFVKAYAFAIVTKTCYGWITDHMTQCENNPEEEGGPCLTCKKVSNSRAGRFPCLRYKITDIRLFKPGQVPGYEWTRRWTNNISDPIQSWATEEPRIIYLSGGLSNKFVKVKVRRTTANVGCDGAV